MINQRTRLDSGPAGRRRHVARAAVGDDRSVGSGATSTTNAVDGHRQRNGREPLSRAPSCSRGPSGTLDTHDVADSDRVGRRRDERVHDARADGVLRARPRRAPGTRAFDVLADVAVVTCVTTATTSSRSARVILEEIGIRDDTPDDLVHDLFAPTMFPEHPLGQAKSSAVSTQSPRNPARRHRRLSRAPSSSRRTWCSRPTGNLTHERLPRVEWPERFPSGNGARPHAAPARCRCRRRRWSVVSRDTEQDHVVPRCPRPTPLSTLIAMHSRS